MVLGRPVIAVRRPRSDGHRHRSNYCFLPDGDQLARIDAIADVPAVLIHGRYDVSGPLDTAWHLHKVWPASRLIVLEDAGHGGTGFTEALVEATDTFRNELS